MLNFDWAAVRQAGPGLGCRYRTARAGGHKSGKRSLLRKKSRWRWFEFELFPAISNIAIQATVFNPCSGRVSSTH
ncbi:hypothetical protein ACKLNR_000721 [Fusarium oxysporum f. sp. zingiberi]